MSEGETVEVDVVVIKKRREASNVSGTDRKTVRSPYAADRRRFPRQAGERDDEYDDPKNQRRAPSRFYGRHSQGRNGQTKSDPKVVNDYNGYCGNWWPER